MPNTRLSDRSHVRQRCENRFLQKLAALALATLACCSTAAAADAPKKAESSRSPNIVFILADDLGYGDVKCLNRDGKIATPNLDRLAAAGMTLTDAHGSSSVCTPTRYSILTGRYNWRSRLQTGVLGGYDKPLIEPGRLTAASLLKQHGYHTACFGKWHLGMNMAQRAAGEPRLFGSNVDFSKPIQNGPTTLGFDQFFGISASLDMPPFVFIANDRFTELPTVEKNWVRKGPAAADFEAIDVLPTLTRKACEYVAERSKSDGPFFLYLPLNSPHTPIVPSKEWQGKSGISPYADFVMETDWAVGQVLDALQQHGLAENTLLMFTSDNGCSPAADIPELEKHGHHPNYIFRGHKADIWDGGHHIPFIARWPGKVKPGSSSDQIVCLGDLLATVAEMLEVKLPDNAGEDSVSFLPALLGKADHPLREALVHHSINGRFAIRQGRWKLELCSGSGGWSKPGDPEAAQQGLPSVQLYDMVEDIGEEKNLQAEHPELVEKMTALLTRYVNDGRSTPGASQKNDADVKIVKPLAKPKAKAKSEPEAN